MTLGDIASNFASAALSLDMLLRRPPQQIDYFDPFFGGDFGVRENPDPRLDRVQQLGEQLAQFRTRDQSDSRRHGSEPRRGRGCKGAKLARKSRLNGKDTAAAG